MALPTHPAELHLGPIGAAQPVSRLACWTSEPNVHAAATPKDWGAASQVALARRARYLPPLASTRAAWHPRALLTQNTAATTPSEQSQLLAASARAAAATPTPALVSDPELGPIPEGDPSQAGADK